jgi:hypothetical protein
MRKIDGLKQVSVDDTGVVVVGGGWLWWGLREYFDDGGVWIELNDGADFACARFECGKVRLLKDRWRL